MLRLRKKEVCQGCFTKLSSDRFNSTHLFTAKRARFRDREKKNEGKPARYTSVHRTTRAILYDAIQGVDEILIRDARRQGRSGRDCSAVHITSA